MKRIPFYLFFFSGACISSCNSSRSSVPAAAKIGQESFKGENVVVKTAQVSFGTFDLEIISNGDAHAIRNAEIKFPFVENIQSVLIGNGQSVHKGQLLACLDTAELSNRVIRSREALDKALVDLDDRLIDYGYRVKDSLNIPKDIMRMAKTRSGYNAAQYNYCDALSLLYKSRVTAPFSGKIADLEAREFNHSGGFRKLCNVIDDSRMTVEFKILETEYRHIANGCFIEVMPYGNSHSIKGTITQINPLIDENGMIKITALANNASGVLMDGMQVKIVIKKAIAGNLYVPKEAVVQRDNKDVVFTCEEGRAKWNYVETGQQNTRYVSIRSGLQKGQQVIISNNINLAHDVEVTIDKNTAVVY